MLRLVPFAAVLTLASAPAWAADPTPLEGRWADPDGALYTIELQEGAAVLVDARLGAQVLTVSDSTWGNDGLSFAVTMPAARRTITYKVLSADETKMEALWWTNDGRGGQETLRRAAPPEKDPKLLIGKWEDRSLKSTYWIQLVGEEPAVIGGVNARGVPKMVTARSVQGAVAIWTITVPKTGYEMTYRCEPGAKADDLACTWSSVSPTGERREGAETLRRLPM